MSNLCYCGHYWCPDLPEVRARERAEEEERKRQEREYWARMDAEDRKAKAAQKVTEARRMLADATNGNLRKLKKLLRPKEGTA